MLKKILLPFSIFVTLISGILWQGGDLFWFGPAAASSTLLLLLYVSKYYKTTTLLPRHPINHVLLLFIAWCFATVFWSEIPAISLIKAITIAAAPIGLYSYFFITGPRFQWEKLWHIILAAGLLLFIHSVIEVSIGINPPDALFLNKNTFAAYLNLILLPGASYFLLEQKSGKKYLSGTILFLIAYSHFMPGSRGASLGLFIGLGILFAMSWKYVSKKNLAQLSAIMVSAAILATMTTVSLFRFVQYDIGNIDNGRKPIWQATINLLHQTPWYGNGIGTFWAMYPQYRLFNDGSAGQNAHNDYLQYLIETGIPGEALLILLVLTIVYSWWRFIKNDHTSNQHKIEATGLIGGVIAIGLHAFFTYNLGVFSILYLSGLLLGRFIFLSQKTSQVTLFQPIPIRSSIFKLLSAATATLLILYFSAISVFSFYLDRAADEFNAGKISKADGDNAIALSIYPYDDRVYLLYVQMFEVTLEKMPELTAPDKMHFFNQALLFLSKAKKLNPYRPGNYYLHAKLLEENPELAISASMTDNIERLYLSSIRHDHLYLPAYKRLANFYITHKQPQAAADLLFNAIQYSHPANDKTLEFYRFAESILQKQPDQKGIRLVTLKIEKLQQALALKKDRLKHGRL